jgi:GTPase
MHKAGFVGIIGKPNMGKSTLLNALMGEKMAIISPKVQTTRHRIKGILNSADYQIVFSDTPGIIKPAYQMQENMMEAVSSTIEDADVLLFMTDIFEKHAPEEVQHVLSNTSIPLAILVNKLDLLKENKIEEVSMYWKEKYPHATIIPISARDRFNTLTIIEFILEHLDEHPPFYDKDEISDKQMRFFVSEIVREKIFELFDKEVPYSSEVVVSKYKEAEKIVSIDAEVIVERESQKAIILGKGGEKIKQIGMLARADIERFIDQKVFLSLHVKVIPDWRKKDNYLKQFGYNN